jgi:hypothetical protein
VENVHSRYRISRLIHAKLGVGKKRKNIDGPVARARRFSLKKGTPFGVASLDLIDCGIK